MTFETIHSEVLYRGRAFNVRREEVRMPDGHVAQLDIVDHVGAVTILPLDEAGRIWFVRQYRHAAGVILLELPAGTLEAGESPDECACREIREEIGMSAAELRKVGEFFLAPGYSSEYMHVYLATGLHADPLPGDADEFLSVDRLLVEQVYDMVQTGGVRDAKTLTALFLARPLLLG